MDKQAVIKKLIGAVERQSVNIASNFSGAGWLGQSSNIQTQLNIAIDTWLKRGDNSKIIGIIEVMQTMGLLAEAEASKLRKAIDKL